MSLMTEASEKKPEVRAAIAESTIILADRPIDAEPRRDSIHVNATRSTAGSIQVPGESSFPTLTAKKMGEEPWPAIRNPYPRSVAVD